MQSGISVEVIVVADTDQMQLNTLRDLTQQAGEEVRLIHTGGGKGAAFARNQGTLSARAPWLAYLDDDDAFLEGKLLQQLDVAMLAQQRPLVSCQFRSSSARSGRLRSPIPRYVFHGDQPLERWLFYRRRLSVHRNIMHTSTLFMPTDLARDVAWRPELHRHQDWDFILRCARRNDVVAKQIPKILAAVSLGASESISGGSDWESSLRWAEDMRGNWDDATYVDFLAGQPLRYAVQARSVEGIRRTFAELRGRGKPTLNASLLAAGGLLPRPTFNRILEIVPDRPRRSKTSQPIN